MVANITVRNEENTKQSNVSQLVPAQVFGIVQKNWFNQWSVMMNILPNLAYKCYIFFLSFKYAKIITTSIAT